jgi:hypothetical protein
MITQKLKICSICNKPAKLWKSKPALCFNCARKQAAAAAIEKSKGEHNHKGLTASEDGKPAKVFKAIAPVGKKLAKKRREYKPLRDKYLIEHPICELQILCNGSPATEVHHVKPREFFLCDVSVFKAACHLCHDWIPGHDAEARQMGFLQSKHS